MSVVLKSKGFDFAVESLDGFFNENGMAHFEAF